MTRYRPKYITFDTHGTLINFQMAEAATAVYADRLSAPAMKQFIEDFRGYRLDECMGDWKPYNELVHNALERSCKKAGIQFERRKPKGLNRSMAACPRTPRPRMPTRRSAAWIWVIGRHTPLFWCSI